MKFYSWLFVSIYLILNLYNIIGQTIPYIQSVYAPVEYGIEDYWILIKINRGNLGKVTSCALPNPTDQVYSIISFGDIDSLRITYTLVTPNKNLSISCSIGGLTYQFLNFTTANIKDYPTSLNVQYSNRPRLALQRNDMTLDMPSTNWVFFKISNYLYRDSRDLLHCRGVDPYKCSLIQDPYHPDVFQIQWNLEFLSSTTTSINIANFTLMPNDIVNPGSLVIPSFTVSTGTGQVTDSFYQNNLIDQEVVVELKKSGVDSQLRQIQKTDKAASTRNFYPMLGSPQSNSTHYGYFSVPYPVLSTNSQKFQYTAYTGSLLTIEQEMDLALTLTPAVWTVFGYNVFTLNGTTQPIVEILIGTKNMVSFTYFQILLNNKVIPSFPYGYYGTLTSASFKASVMFPVNMRQVLDNNFVQYVTKKPMSFTYSNASINDLTPPIITSVSVVPIGRMKGILRVTATDIDGTGVAKIYLTPHLLTSANLVSGSLTDGTFESIIDYSIHINDPLRFSQNLIQSYFNISDYSLNYYAIDPLNYGFPYTPPSDDFHINPFDLTEIRFKFNNVDLSDHGIWNTVYLKYNGASNNHSPYFVPLIIRGVDNFNLEKLERFRMEWDNIVKAFKYDFYMPSRLYSGTIDYNIYIKPWHFTVQSLYSVLGSQVLLNVTSQQGDELPPIFSSFTTGTLSNNTGYYVTFALESSLVPFKNGIIQFTSSLDNIGYTIEFTNSDLVNGSVTFNRLLVIQPTVGHTYKVTRVELTDESGHMSSLNGLFINPFFKIFSTAQREFSIIAAGSSESILPSIADFEVTPRFFQQNGNVQVSVNFTTTDNSNLLDPRYIPIIYAENLIGDIFSVPAQGQNILSDGKIQYTTTFTLPFRFGYGQYGLSLSVYGWADASSNIAGLSTYDLSNRFVGKNYLIPNSTFLETVPFINGNSLVSSRGGLLSILGFNFSPGSTVNVDYQDGNGYKVVSGVSVLSSSIFTFISEPTLLPIKVKFITDSMVVSNEWFVIPQIMETLAPTPLPISCPGTPPCGGSLRGSCVAGIGCQCIYPYTGLDCQSQFINTTIPDPNTEQPSSGSNYTTTLPNGNAVTYRSLISIVGLLEQDYNGNPIQNYTFSQWIYSDLSLPNKTVYSYTTNFTHESTGKVVQVNVSIQWFERFEIIEFANQRLEMNPSTLKYQIRISQYPFESYLNTLQLIISSTIQSSNENEGCSLKQFDSESTENFEYMKLQIDNHSLYGRFIRRAIIDDQITSVNNILLDDKFQNTINSSNYNQQSYIGIQIPNFRNYTLIDPDFSLLINSKSADDTDEGAKCIPSSSKSGLTREQLIGIIVGSIVGAIFLSIIFIFIIYKKYLKYNKHVLSLIDKIKK
ncbi:hypothetical protein DLAC_05766 [Tieghemostelium lacteum]|uniref:EGF-like domain-containing protein n=1 Tax=Tieghemostelium lacteum TaxID=361077 RepID=A0A151ZGS9_TIELA|nr:hypothetical protein DLAC_05766 [Tieghemostelium lacteum]|eukprot:KYQ93135.1 hypothetical protein DLAC_05766 [Tieghemostelium lacteum]